MRRARNRIALYLAFTCIAVTVLPSLPLGSIGGFVPTVPGVTSALGAPTAGGPIAPSPGSTGSTGSLSTAGTKGLSHPSSVAAAGTSGTTTNAAVAAAAVARHDTSSIKLQVQASRNSLSSLASAPKALQAIRNYKWLINLDNTGQPAGGKDDPKCHPSTNVNYPTGCYWPSIRYAVASPAVSEGTQSDWNGGSNGALPTYNGVKGLPDNCDANGDPLPFARSVLAVNPCRYLVSVTADGYQLGGTHFTVPMNLPGTVKVFLNPFPIPLGTMKLKVFADTKPTDGTYDEQNESGLVGFNGLINDIDGIVTADYFGNALCTQYVTNPTTGLIILNAAGKPTPTPAQTPAPPDPVTGYYNPTVPGKCMSDTNGDVTIPNLAPNHYSANITPPDDHIVDKHWIQTTTLEGNHDHDVWIMPADTGLDTELVVSGEAVPFVQFGFVPATAQPDTWSCPAKGIPGQTPGCGSITGQIWGASSYLPGIGALPGVGGANGQTGIKLDHPIDRGWVSLNNLNASTGDFDQMVATIPADKNGSFQFNNVPDGDYTATVWDEPQDHALDNFSVTISNGQVIDMGTLPLLGWFAHIYGHVFIDTNGNGRQDPGEKGLFHATVQNLNRTNNAMAGGINTSDTDFNGFYDFKEAYPLGLMSINQFFNTRFKTTGITYQACNDPKEHTILTPIVDVSYLPIISQCGRLDWAVQPYNDATTGGNGGEVATMIYDQVRSSYSSRQAKTGDFQTGIPGMRVEQFTPVKGAPLGGVDGPGGHDALSGYALNADGSFETVEQMTQNNGQGCSALPSTQPCYMSENNGGPTNCYPMDANGKPIGFDPTNPQSLDFMVYGGGCVEATGSGTQFGLGTDNPLLHGVQTVDGNYALPGIPGGDNLVHISVPVDHVLNACPTSGNRPLGCTAANAGLERPLFSSTVEEDVNFNVSAQYVPQGADLSHLPWPAQLPSGGRHISPGNYDENSFTTGPGPDPICAGPTHVVHVTNKAFLAGGGSPFEGQTRSDCATKLFHAQPGQSIAPNFHFHTVVDVPLPAHYWGYIVDDVSVDTNKKGTSYGEVHGLQGVPVGVYDWTGRRTYSVNSDYNGVWEVLMPSADIFNCPVPAGTCPNVYRFVGNDPGQPGSPNLNFDHNYRTISANFEAWPNMLVPADTAPTRTVSSIEGPGVQFTSLSLCAVKDQQPNIFAIGPDPYTSATNTTITIKGANFGTKPGSVEFKSATGVHTLKLAGTWSDHELKVTIGTSVDVGPGSITVVSGALDPNTGQPFRSTNGVTFHILGTGYNPHIITVGPGKQIDPFAPDPAHPGQLLHGFPIQEALDRAASAWQAAGVADLKAGKSVADAANDPNLQYLVVVYPKWGSTNQNAAFLPLGTYFENLIVHSPVKLQGLGPGGNYADPSGNAVSVQGSIIDGRFFNTMTSSATDAVDPANGGEGVAVPGPSDPGEPVIQHWVNLMEAIQTSAFGTGFTPNTAGDIGWSGANNPLGEGAVITVLGTTGTYPTTDARSHASIDGFTISGGDQSDFPGNLNEVSGQRTAKFPEGGNTDEMAGALSVQGGAIYVNGGTDFMGITNNSIKQNSGAYGAVRFGTLFQSDSRLDGGLSHNYNSSVSHNVFAANGGQNLAGAIGIFTDTKDYSIDNNTFCMNSAAEYGGAISHHGYSPGGNISYNKIFLNTAFDEGGAITISSEPGFAFFGGDVIPDPVAFTQGTGDVSITHNYISSNLAQDDGGAMRIMGTTGTKGLSPITITDNMLTNNISAHEGGAISINDAAVVNIVNNTIAKNVTTATATTSNGQAAPAGVSTGLNSGALDNLLQTMYTSGAPLWMGPTRLWPGFSNPLIQNDIFHDNRAGSWTPNGVAGIGMPGDTTPVNLWDAGSVDGAVTLTIRNSLLDTATGFTPDPSNRIGTDPVFMGSYDTKIQTVQQRTYFRFRPSAIVSVDLPENVVGDYRVKTGSPALLKGVNPAADGTIVVDDINGRPRPTTGTLLGLPAGAGVPITAGATEGGAA
jgi:hypothetical protein